MYILYTKLSGQSDRKLSDQVNDKIEIRIKYRNSLNTMGLKHFDRIQRYQRAESATPSKYLLTLKKQI